MDLLSLLRDVLTKLQFVSQPFFMCLTFVLLFERYAGRFGMLDKPDDRKRHGNPVAMVGGPAVYFATTLSIIVFVPHSITALFIAIGGLVLALGLADDRFDLPVRWRILAQLVIAWLTVAYAGVEINSIGNLVGLGAFELNGLFGVVFTVLCIVGVINSMNMIDGVDGLAGSICALTLAGLAFLCWRGGYLVGMRMTLIFIGALLAFLCFNSRAFLPRAKIFFGDSGSTLMGFVLAWFLISLTQSSDHYISSVVAGWLFGLPLMDTVSVMVRRVMNGQSPMQGGRDHLHHRLIDGGLSVNASVLVMLVLHGSLVLIGVIANGHPGLEPALFVSFIVLTVAYHFSTPAIVTVLVRHFGDPVPSPTALAVPAAPAARTASAPSASPDAVRPVNVQPREQAVRAREQAIRAREQAVHAREQASRQAEAASSSRTREERARRPATTSS